MLWRPKLLYCLEYGARSLLMPYLVVFLKDSGLTGGEIGVILLCRQICSIVGSPFWGAVADSTGQQKAVLLGCQLTAACVRVLIYYGWSFWSYLSLVILAECIGAPVTAMMDASTLHLLGDRSQDYGKQRKLLAYCLHCALLKLYRLMGCRRMGNFSISWWADLHKRDD